MKLCFIYIWRSEQISRNTLRMYASELNSAFAKQNKDLCPLIWGQRLSIFIKFCVQQYPSEISHTESAELLYSHSMLLLKQGKDFTAFKIKMPLNTHYQKVASSLPTCWMLRPTIKKSCCLFFDRQRQHFHGEEICAIKIIPISQKSRRVKQWSVHLISI